MKRPQKTPNATTRRILLQARAGKNIRHYRSRRALFRDLGLR